MKRLALILTVLNVWMGMMAQKAETGVDLTKATIVYTNGDAPLVKHMAQVLADDIERVSGLRPQVSMRQGKGQNIIIGTVKCSRLHRALGTFSFI